MMFPALWLIPMHIARNVGPWAEELTLDNDAEYFTRVLLASRKVLFCPGARCRYRSGLVASLSGLKSKKAWASQYRALQLCEEYLRQRENSERVRRGFALCWQQIAHAAYPYDSEVAERAIERARALHPIISHPNGGRAFMVAARLLGWRLARRLQVASGRP